MKSIVSFLSGRKTYIVGFVAAIYGAGVTMGVWPHSAGLDLLLGGTATVTMRAGIAKTQNGSDAAQPVQAQKAP